MMGNPAEKLAQSRQYGAHLHSIGLFVNESFSHRALSIVNVVRWQQTLDDLTKSSGEVGVATPAHVGLSHQKRGLLRPPETSRGF